MRPVSLCGDLGLLGPCVSKAYVLRCRYTCSWAVALLDSIICKVVSGILVIGVKSA